MRAAWIDSFGGPEVIHVGDYPPPICGSGEVLVRLAAATLNHRDIYLRRGEAGHIDLPVILGSDGAGEVVGGDATGEFAAGSRVAIYPVLACGICKACRESTPHKCRTFGMVGGERNGTHTEYVAVPKECLVPLPANLDFDTAASISLAGLTAWNMVVDEAHVKAGEQALVMGASGGVGVFTVLLLKRLGVTVHAVTSDLSKRSWLLSLGADNVLQDDPATVLRYTRRLPDGGVDLAFNWVGGDTWRYVPPSVRSGGRILVCGSVRSPVAELDMRQVFYRNIRLLGCSMGTPLALRKMLEIAAIDPRVRAPIDSIISLRDIGDAHRRMENGRLTGKIVIHP